VLNVEQAQKRSVRRKDESFMRLCTPQRRLAVCTTTISLIDLFVAYFAGTAYQAHGDSCFATDASEIKNM
jgi:hypothetical protein